MNRILLTIAVAVMTATAIVAKNVEVIPCPNYMEIHEGTFAAAGADFRYDTRFDASARDAIIAFADRLSFTAGRKSKVRKGTSDKGFVFAMNPDLPSEAYRLSISKEAARVEASSLNGVIYAIQTIKQMLPVQIYGKTISSDADWTLPCAEINDAPRYSYRGMMLDVARHFFTVQQVKKCLDLMEIHKLNTFHWHLTDDQGWRIEIRKYPKLTQIGSVRKETMAGHYRENRFDGTPYGEGMWYTQDQIREVVAYAASKGITVIPEIDLPGHMVGALASYPELGCTGGPYEVRTKWGIADEALCAGKETTYEFLQNVLSEVCDLFPGEYIHIGGDECRKGCWEKCPHCQAKIQELGYKDDDRHTAEQYLQSYVTRRMEDFLKTKGKRLIGWEEILEGNLSPSATVMSWRGKKAEIEAVSKGHDVIMAPKTHCYLDYYQARDKENEPLSIGGYLPVETSYCLEPEAGLNEQQSGHILGVQANLWTEYIADEDHLYYMLLPRMTALTEVQWCNKDNKDWNRFVKSMDHMSRIYDILGYDYGKHIRQFGKTDWELVWTEDFNGSEIDENVWTRVGHGPSDWNRMMSLRDGLAFVEDGQLVLLGKVNDDLAADNTPFVTGGIRSQGKKSFRMARFEIRAKFNSAQGFWPALWLMPDCRLPKPEYAEIDIMEHLNHESKAYQTVHSRYTLDGNVKQPKGSTTEIDKDGWNVYGVEVHEDQIRFFVNGALTFTYNKEEGQKYQFPWPEYPFFIILSNQLGGKWVGEIDAAQLPSELRVDWIKVYQRPLSNN